MKTKQITIETTLCKQCKVCVEICPAVVFTIGHNGIATRPERVPICISCGQCMAACSEKAIHVEGLSYEKDFFEFSTNGDVFQNLVESRRSVRAFKNKPVPHEDLEKIVEAITFSPPSFPPLKIELVVVQDRKLIKETLPVMIGLYDKMMEALKKPISRFFIKRSMGAVKYKVVMNQLFHILNAKLPSMKNGTEDAIFRNAQAVILFHAHKDAENCYEDAFIALSFGLLKAHSLGLGACAVELIPPAINRIPQLKEKFRIPEQNQVIIAMILGYPKYKYKRGIRRNLKSVLWIEE